MVVKHDAPGFVDAPALQDQALQGDVQLRPLLPPVEDENGEGVLFLDTNSNRSCPTVL